VLTLVSGPGRSGKSRWAEHLAERTAMPVLYLATAPRLEGDASWQARLREHRRRRPPNWGCLEVGGHLTETLQGCNSEALLLIDSLGTWLVHHLGDDDQRWSERCGSLLQALKGCHQPVILVTEEVGWGVMPTTAVGRMFRDRLGALQAALEAKATASWLVVHGRAMPLHHLAERVEPTRSKADQAGRREEATVQHAQEGDPMRVVLFEPRIPPNTGNVARTCAGFQVSLHLIEPLGFELDDRHLRRAGLDYWPWVDLTVHNSWKAFQTVRQHIGGRLVAFSRHGETPLTRLRFQAGDWLLFGREDLGLPEVIRREADVRTCIPMPGGSTSEGGVRSFNLASACAAGLFEALRQTDSRLT